MLTATGCASVPETAPAHFPARFAAPSPAAHDEVARVLAQVLGHPVDLAEDALVEASQLRVTTAPSVAGPTGSAGERFRLIWTDGECALLRQGTGERHPLTEVVCEPWPVAAPPAAGAVAARTGDHGAAGLADESPPRSAPAHLGRGPGSLHAELACPSAEDLGGGEVTVFCRTEVLASGVARPAETVCDTFASSSADSPASWTPTPPEAYERLVRRAVNRAEFGPAHVEGTPRSVRMGFRVIFVREDGRCLVRVPRNLGFQSARFGLDYVAPQELSGDGGWRLRVDRPKRMMPDAVRGPRPTLPDGKAVVVSVGVDAAGAGSDAAIENVEPPYNVRAEMAVRALSGARFVPGLHRGRPTPMRYYEVLPEGF